ncbi:DsbA family oxidoreductase [Lutimaribacter sp. EGI FJ00015]|uniref:DsbA family oxidoreductase n=1 Tax=Lutimaribacter degradans TaxID=2945989 RepID=A0ACC5ZVY5_9RHOB|nr:DsbA family oxidoreductase [Lutimaribacter sp. EGI FJ00013]MCM2562360.1 DsbA family oxidoreductase [Lutimaribacter sp. EGI FJ00013]MCO0613516.1 DsbA family oxidoreductase [Lutimaribacter sp. EGI FJ00015]MCO0636489.1 DsbA family oxidoreductase [Lutimaribacter sp. EGI FJ00014]
MTMPQIRVDIVSDIMCPWCIIGYKELEAAAAQTGVTLGLRWHPFELNPDMGPDGEEMTAHIMRKYGITQEQSAENRAVLKQRGAALGIDFAFAPGTRMRNSFRAHQLIDWAEGNDAQHDMKLALFAAHFSAGLNVDDIATLAGIAETLGLDASDAEAALHEGRHADAVRRKQAFWQQQGITGVPAMVFAQQYLVTGAQGPEGYAHILHQLVAEPA